MDGRVEGRGVSEGGGGQKVLDRVKWSKLVRHVGFNFRSTFFDVNEKWTIRYKSRFVLTHMILTVTLLRTFIKRPVNFTKRGRKDAFILIDIFKITYSPSYVG